MTTASTASPIVIAIDGTTYRATDGQSVLHVAHAHHLSSIPSVCFHRRLGSSGACRLCVVEMEDTGQLAYACTLPATDGVRVRSETPAVRASRTQSVRLLMTRDRQSATLRDIARAHTDIPETEFDPDSDPGCVLCGLCVSRCTEVGPAGLQFMGRARDRQIALISSEVAGLCTSCNSCRKVCPTGYLDFAMDRGILLRIDREKPKGSKTGESRTH